MNQGDIEPGDIEPGDTENDSQSPMDSDSGFIGRENDSHLPDTGISLALTSLQTNEGGSVTSFQDAPILPAPKGIWEDLRRGIERQIKKDDIRKDALQILPGQTMLEEDYVDEAVTTTYHDVAEFYAWYFSADDNRTMWMGDKASQNKTLEGKFIPWVTDMPAALRNKVQAVVADNLKAMRDAGEIPEGQDTDYLEDAVTDSLTRYIVNWPSWYYDRHELEAIEAYFEAKAVHDAIYYDDADYGTLANLLEGGVYDGVSDVPYIYEE